MDGPQVWSSSHLLLEHLCPHFCLPPYVADSLQTHDNKYSCMSHWVAAFLYSEGKKRRLLSPVWITLLAKCCPRALICCLHFSPSLIPVPSSPTQSLVMLRRVSCTSGSLLHVNIPLVRKGTISRKMVMLTLTVTRDTEVGLFVNIYLLCRVLVMARRSPIHCGRQGLVPWPEPEPMPPASGVQSLSHWTTREVQVSLKLK